MGNENREEMGGVASEGGDEVCAWLVEGTEVWLGWARWSISQQTSGQGDGITRGLLRRRRSMRMRMRMRMRRRMRSRRRRRRRKEK